VETNAGLNKLPLTLSACSNLSLFCSLQHATRQAFLQKMEHPQTYLINFAPKITTRFSFGEEANFLLLHNQNFATAEAINLCHP
jgi:hypothetical protein